MAPPGGAAPPGGGRTYYGNAEPKGPTVRVGGLDRSVGGWAGYEIDRRHARWAVSRDERPSRYYGGRSFISAQDVLESIFAPPVAGGGARGGGPGDPLGRAAERLAGAIERLDGLLARRGPSSPWARLGLPPDEPLAVPGVSPEEVRGARPETDVASLHYLADLVSALVASYAHLLPGPPPETPAPPERLPPAPRRVVGVRGGRDPEEAICRLERDTAARAAAVEEYRAEVAAHFDAAAAALERLVGGAP